MNPFKKIFVIFSLFFLATASYAQDSQHTIDVDFGFRYNSTFGMHQMQVTSYEEGLVINNIVINRGQCELTDVSKKEFPIKAGYSENFIVAYRPKKLRVDCRNPQEIVFDTNHGITTFQRN